MFDIIRFRSEVNPDFFGFERFYFLEEAKGKILQAESLEKAATLRNRKALILLQDHAFDEGALKLIAEKKQLCFLIDLGRLIRSRGVSRAVAMSKLRNFLRLCNKYGAFYSFASFAENESQIRTTDELMHIAMLLGVNRGQARFALEMAGGYL